MYKASQSQYNNNNNNNRKIEQSKMQEQIYLVQNTYFCSLIVEIVLDNSQHQINKATQ